MSFIDKVKFGNLSLKDKEKTLKDDEVSSRLKELGLYDELFEMPPPSNSSPTTKEELTQVLYATKNVSESTLEFCQNAEDDLVQLFVDFLYRYSITDVTRQQLDEVLDQTEPLLYRLKEHYCRPRPNQLAVYYDLDLYVKIETKAANHPAYPSGHSYESYIMAALLSQKYPKHKEKLMRFANSIGLSRILIGVHYKSDHEFGVYLAKLLIDNDLVEL